MLTIKVILTDEEGETVDEFVTLEDISRLFRDHKIQKIKPTLLTPYLRNGYPVHIYHDVMFKFVGSSDDDETKAVSINYSQA